MDGVSVFAPLVMLPLGELHSYSMLLPVLEPVPLSNMEVKLQDKIPPCPASANGGAMSSPIVTFAVDWQLLVRLVTSNWYVPGASTKGESVVSFETTLGPVHKY